MQFFDIHIVSIVSSVSARKLKCPSLARNLHSSARAGKIRLGLITTLWVEFDMAAHKLNLEDGKIAIYRKEFERKRKELQMWMEKVSAASTSLPSSQ